MKRGIFTHTTILAGNEDRYQLKIFTPNDVIIMTGLANVDFVMEVEEKIRKTMEQHEVVVNHTNHNTPYLFREICKEMPKNWVVKRQFIDTLRATFPEKIGWIRFVDTS